MYDQLNKKINTRPINPVFSLPILIEKKIILKKTLEVSNNKWIYIIGYPGLGEAEIPKQVMYALEKGILEEFTRSEVLKLCVICSQYIEYEEIESMKPKKETTKWEF